MYDFDVMFENEEWVSCVLDHGEPIIQIVPGLTANKKFEAEKTLETWVGMENGEIDATLECVKDDIVGIDTAQVEYELDGILDILQEVRAIVKSKRAKELLENAIDRIEDDVRYLLGSIDTSTELACERINEFLEKNKN